MSSQGYGVHFFKVILQSTLQKGELKVPTSFVRRHWQGMSNPVFLILPNGMKWKVYWLKRDGDVWLCNGWKEFAKYVHLDVSHFVVFRCEENSCFNVIVFGKSALEIEYPSSNEEVEEIDDSNISLKIVEDRSPFEGKKPKSPLPPSSRTSKKMKITPKEEPQEEEPLKKKAGFDNSRHMNRGSSGADFKRRIKTFHDKVKTMFHSENDHFTCLIQKTYAKKDLLVLPMEFSKPYLHTEGHVKLFIEESRSWDVELKVNYYGQLTFASGWRGFLLDNKLKVGDVCGFELHKSKGFSFEVTIYRLEEDDSSPPLFKGEEGHSDWPCSSLKTPLTPKASTSMATDDFCICVKHPLSSPTVPFNYMKKYVNENGRYVTLRVGNKSRRVKLLYYEKNSFARFSSGWTEFLKDWDLEEGDACICKLVDQQKLVFQVSILKGQK